MSKNKRTPDDRRQQWLEDLNEEFRYEIVLNESDRGAVLVASAFVEEALEHLLRQVFTVKSCNTSDEKFASQLNHLTRPGIDAPLGSFSSRITLAYVLGIIDVDYLTALEAFRNLRNSYAHRKANGTRPKLSAEAVMDIRSNVIGPGIWDIRYVGLLTIDVDFDSTVAIVGMFRISFALSVWMLLRTIIDETNWWKHSANAQTPIRSVPKFSGPTFRESDN
ncbi:MAG: hypothetical protein CME33_09305 [Gimesia sp.]|uniref:hypothetical protein n=1 Tax=Gimesia sp. TaxID=2024833 RepID=UPI000C443AAD|nr:hypothetical protein [Gimesia sp.]MAX36746.1 hypothetical protein [Gimesia sp.]|tara:strand:- start:5973 stop:6635 length:663 start_codon:yes stop_codon:yes gene_type:complete